MIHSGNPVPTSIVCRITLSSFTVSVLARPPQCGPAIVIVSVVRRLSVCRAQVSPKLSEIDLRLLLNWNRKSGLLIQNLPSDLRP